MNIPTDPIGSIPRPRVLLDAIGTQSHPLAHLGTTDDCSFAPFSDDTSTSRDTALAKIKARLEGTALAEKLLQERG